MHFKGDESTRRRKTLIDIFQDMRQARKQNYKQERSNRWSTAREGVNTGKCE